MNSVQNVMQKSRQTITIATVNVVTTKNKIKKRKENNNGNKKNTMRNIFTFNGIYQTSKKL